MAIEVRSADIRAVVVALRRMPEVGRVHSTNGRWDLVAEIALEQYGSVHQRAGADLRDRNPARARSRH